MLQQPVSTASPLNRFPLWKYLLIVALVIISTLYALPNVFGESPAIEISLRTGKPITSVFADNIKGILHKHNVSVLGIDVHDKNLEIKFADHDVQIKAQEILEKNLDKQYVVALDLVPNAPNWLAAIGASPMKLGLDLRGGMYFLLEIDMQTVVHNQLNSYVTSIKETLRKSEIYYKSVLLHGKNINVSLRDASYLQKAEEVLAEKYPEFKLTTDKTAPSSLTVNAKESYLKQIKSYAAQQVVQVMRNRVNELGVSEASVAKQGDNHVVIELPGLQDATRAKQIIGGTSTLNFLMVNENADVEAALKGNIPLGSSLYYTKDGKPVVLKNRIILTGKSVVGAISGYDQQTNLPAVHIKISGSDVLGFSRVTRENIGRSMAVVLVETTFNKVKVNGKLENRTRTTNKIISVATINSQLGNSFQITGLSNEASRNLAVMIRAGALPAPVQVVQETQIGPTLGAHNIEMGALSITIAMALVVLFMWLYYGLFGLIADVALLLNVIFIVAVMSILPGATLTLAGIAGIVLNVGMAIDANVLIFERIREEMRNKTSLQFCIHRGYEKAFATIIDSN
ncbi:MAG: protein translocase subunit SecD, partial [Thiotrichales bacterium]